MAAKIYTKTGDDGTTGLFSGERVKKSAKRVSVYGTVDELNSLLGAIRAHAKEVPLSHTLERIQHTLFRVGSELAAPGKLPRDIPMLEASETAWLEGEIDLMEGKLTPLKNFILPSGCSTGSYLHYARAVARRAEREAVELSEHERVRPEVLVFLNRLSDFLFVLARFINHEAGSPEILWKK